MSNELRESFENTVIAARSLYGGVVCLERDTEGNYTNADTARAWKLTEKVAAQGGFQIEVTHDSFGREGLEISIDYARLKPTSRAVIRDIANALEEAYFERIEA